MKRKSGFTIIEVSLVLAIAGMILLMVFIALPALQRSSRDTERREDMMTLISEIKKYQSNNRGSLPTESGSTSWDNFYSKYLNDRFTDPSSGEKYSLITADCGKSNANEACTTSYASVGFPNDYKITVVTGAICNGESAIKSNNPRRVAVLYKLELGVYCGNT